jgi:hypothetical protein
MSLKHTNGQSDDNLVGAAGFDPPRLTNIPIAEEVAVRVMDLPTDIIHTPPDNDINMEAVEELCTNMGEHGQLVEIIVFPHPTLVEHYLCADGNHRLAAKRLLGQTVRARILDKAPDEAELITIRVTTATIGKTVDKAVVGADIFRWMELTGADQAQATAHFGYTSQSAICKLLRPYKNGIEELLTALKERRIAPTSAYLVAALPVEVQRTILPQVLGKKREAVQRIVQAAKGAKPKGAKVLKLTCGGVVATVKGDSVAALRTFIAKAAEALKKLERDKLPPEFLSGLMR